MDEAVFCLILSFISGIVLCIRDWIRDNKKNKNLVR